MYLLSFRFIYALSLSLAVVEWWWCPSSFRRLLPTAAKKGTDHTPPGEKAKNFRENVDEGHIQESNCCLKAIAKIKFCSFQYLGHHGPQNELKKIWKVAKITRPQWP